MACFVYMFVSPSFQCSLMCLLEIKKELHFRFSLVWLLSRKGQVTELCREGHKPAKHFLWHAACGWQGFKCVCFPFALSFVPGKDSAKYSCSCSSALLTCLLFLLLAQALSRSGCCHGLNLSRPMAGDKSRAATGALLCPGMSAACGGLEPPHLQQIHLEGQYCCLLSLNEEEYVKSSYPQQGCKLWITVFNWHLGRCLKPSCQHL